MNEIILAFSSGQGRYDGLLTENDPDDDDDEEEEDEETAAGEEAVSGGLAAVAVDAIKDTVRG